MSTNPERFAVIRNANPETIAAYLPANYRVGWVEDRTTVYIRGVDEAGWTLDGYVLPRLASGLYFGEEWWPAHYTTDYYIPGKPGPRSDG